MRICVIHGSNRKGNTDKTIDIIKQTLNSADEMVYTDFFCQKICRTFAMVVLHVFGPENMPDRIVPISNIPMSF